MGSISPTSVSRIRARRRHRLTRGEADRCERRQAAGAAKALAHHELREKRQKILKGYIKSPPPEQVDKGVKVKLSFVRGTRPTST
jgi:hypothetical protein